VNHIGTQDEIVIFAVEKNPEQSPPVSLRYIRSVRSPAFGVNVLNDVIEGMGPGELYTSQWLTFPHPIGGQDMGTSLQIVIHKLLTLLPALYVPSTRVHRCTWDDSDPTSEASCTVAASGLIGANGMSTVADRSIVLVSELPAARVSVFRRNEGGDLTKLGHIETPHMIDNIDYDSARGVFTVATVPFPIPALKCMDGEKIPVAGGLLEVTITPTSFNKDTQSFEASVTEAVEHDGSLMSMVSIGLRWNNKYVLGSPFSDGVLVCDA